MKKIVEFQHVDKVYGTLESQVFALHDVSFDINEGEFVVMLGPSGAGKSTILNLLGGMDTVTNGHIHIHDMDITAFHDHQLSTYRGEHIGFIFQFYNLIPTLTVYENTSLVKELKKNTLNCDDILKRVNLQDHKHKFPSQLSGGEQQRVSIARAICKKPTLLLCDEPTGALDVETGKRVLQLLYEICKEYHCTTIIVTHNAQIAQIADKVIHVRNGTIEQVINQVHPCSIDEVKW